ncbi:viral IAP-associated factor homolog [Chironomus tepperi]|uniref:viral IAP-associated factor homolog n=1 Tax=Chironomus tepperi TaxID=113505 RepID=UPI00391FA8E7
MQNPNEDTEWNDILRQKGIIPQKEKEITEDDIISMLETTIEQKQNNERNLEKLDLDELDELEDSEDEAVLQEYRNKRIAELKALAAKAKFGSVREITGEEYINEVNKAGEDIYVVLHLYARGVPFCAVLNQYINELAMKYPSVKFIRSIAQTCIPNFPDKNVPTIFVYYNGQMKKQFLGPLELRSPNCTREELEFMLGQSGCIKTDITEDPRPVVQDVLFRDLAENNDW